MTLNELRKYKRILILGYGIEGQATERFLKKFHPDAEIGIGDRKDDPDYLDKQSDYDLAVRTPLLRPQSLTIPYTTATNLFFGNVENTIIGVTGTKGKSTTVSMIHHVLTETGKSSRLLGNIGSPMLDAITSDDIKTGDTIVLELSSYQLEDITYSPPIACFLNIYRENHNHTDFEEYFTAKSQITRHQTADDVFIYNGSQKRIRDLADATKAETEDFALRNVDMIRDAVPFHTHEDNIKALTAIMARLGIHENECIKALQSFAPLPHRLQTVKTYKGVTYIDDSASNHPDSTIFALREVKNVETIILGGQDRGYDFSELVQILAEKKIRHLILFTETDKHIQDLVDAVPDYTPLVHTAATMDEAVRYAIEHTHDGNVCLLSPGAPSYLMYNNFNERGEDFIRTINTYASQEKASATQHKKGEDSSGTEKE